MKNVYVVIEFLTDPTTLAHLPYKIKGVYSTEEKANESAFENSNKYCTITKIKLDK